MDDEKQLWWGEACFIMKWFCIQTLWNSNICLRNAQNAMQLYCPCMNHSIRWHVVSCMKCALIIIKCIAVSIINHSFLGFGYLILSEASQFPWYFCLGLKSEKVTFYLLFKGLIHKAGRLNCWVRPVVSHESHSLASAYIYIHSAHNTMKVSSFMFSQVNIWV